MKKLLKLSLFALLCWANSSTTAFAADGSFSSRMAEKYHERAIEQREQGRYESAERAEKIAEKFRQSVKKENRIQARFEREQEEARLERENRARYSRPSTVITLPPRPQVQEKRKTTEIWMGF